MNKIYFKNSESAIAQLIQFNSYFLEKLNKTASSVDVIVGVANTSKLLGVSVADYYSNRPKVEDFSIIEFGYDNKGAYVVIEPNIDAKYALSIANTGILGVNLSYEEIVKYEFQDQIRLLAVVLEV